ncbi:MAG: hemin ABC transporter substrate-binding protein, partial [Flavobacteriales bacterium]
MILFFTIFVIAACSGPEAKQNDTHRIVSLGGAISETLVALDLLPNIVGRDVTSVFPEDLLEVQD